MARLTLPATWPFRVDRSPLYWGWVIWALSTLGVLMSIPGQTMGMAVFTEHFMAAYGLTRTELSLAYLAGTVASSLLLTRAGRWYDHHGARPVVVGAAVALALCVAAIAGADRLALQLQRWTGLGVLATAFPLVMAAYFGVRFFGQGVLTSASRNVLVEWFDRRRGLVTGVRGVFISLGFALAPPVLAWLILVFGWRGALLGMAAVVGIGFALLALLLLRDTPEACGLRPDNAPQPAADDPPATAATGSTLAEVRRSPVFWLYTLAMAMHALFGTALTFHVEDIFAAVGRSSAEAFGYFLPAAAVSVVVNFSASALADHVRLQPLLVAMLAAFVAGAAGMLQLDTAWGYWTLAVGFGAGGGLWGVLSALAYVRYFGRGHLGEVSGLAMALTVFGSAVGPALFAVGLDQGGSYRMPIWLCLWGNLVLLVAALLVPQREPGRVNPASP